MRRHDSHASNQSAGAIRLSPLEARLLACLQENAGLCLSRSTLLERVWGYRDGTRTRTLDVHIAHLREKLGAEGQARIKTVLRSGYGIRRPDDQVILDSLRVVDAVLKIDTPFGPCWRRYNHDGYGQRDSGEAYLWWGRGRAWPLLTGERGHYELAAGNNVEDFLRTLEKFALPTGMLTEQVWDAPNLPKAHMCLGRPTGAAMPLMWAHAEYIKLLRSKQDGKIFDSIPEVAEPGVVQQARDLETDATRADRQARHDSAHSSAGGVPAALVRRRVANRSGHGLNSHEAAHRVCGYSDSRRGRSAHPIHDAVDRARIMGGA